MSMVRFALCKILLGVQGGALHWWGGAYNFCWSASSIWVICSKLSPFFKWVAGTGMGEGLEDWTRKARHTSGSTSIYEMIWPWAIREVCRRHVKLWTLPQNIQEPKMCRKLWMIFWHWRRMGWAERLFSKSFPPTLAESPAYHEGRSLRLQVCCVVLQKEKKGWSLHNFRIQKNVFRQLKCIRKFIGYLHNA